ncbi:MAG: HEAT repeat domain-containing protein [Planctomycetota bacterium]
MDLEELLEQLWRGEPGVAERLRRLGPEAADAAPALADAVARGDARLRAEAIFVLEGLGPAARPALPSLVQALRDEDLELSAQAADALGAMGGEAVPALIEALDDPDWRVRQAVCQAFGVMGADAGGAVPALLRRVRSERDEVRRRAVWALGEIGDVAALDTLAEVFTEEGGTVGVWIAETFARFGRRARPVATALRAEMHREDPQLAIAAAAALLEIGEYEDAAVWALIARLQDGEACDRVEAAITLGEFGPKARTAIPALKAAERDEDDDLRAQAMVALAKIRPEYAREPVGEAPA